MSRLTRDGTAEPVSRDQILRHARGQGNIHFPCSADHEQDWQPYPVDPYSAICDDHTYIHTYILYRLVLFSSESICVAKTRTNVGSAIDLRFQTIYEYVLRTLVYVLYFPPAFFTSYRSTDEPFFSYALISLQDLAAAVQSFNHRSGHT